MSAKDAFHEHAWPDFKTTPTPDVSGRRGRELDAVDNPSNCKKFASSTLFLTGDRIHRALGLPGMPMVELPPPSMTFPYRLSRFGFGLWRYYRYALAMRAHDGRWTVEECWRYNANPRCPINAEIFGKDLSYPEAVNAVMYYETTRIWELWREYQGTPCATLPGPAELNRYFKTILDPTSQDLERQKFMNNAQDTVKPRYSRSFPHVLRVERKNKMLIEARDRRTQSGLPVVRI